MNIGLAFRAFFAALAGKQSAAIKAALTPTDDAGQAKIAPSKTESKSPSPKSIEVVSKRSDALTMLALLQREARLLDLVQEPLGQYSDAQVGAAAREVLQTTGKVIQRMFAIAPLSDASEGSQVDLPATPSSARWKLTGAAANQTATGAAW